MFSQTTVNSKDFFPYIDSTREELIQTIQITTEDTMEFVCHKYEYKSENNKQYLISSTYDADSLLTTVLKEEITKKGLKFVIGYKIEHDTLGNSYSLPVNGNKKITFPFKSLNKMKNWKVSVRNSFDNKVVVKSKIEYLGLDTLSTKGKELVVINFKRTVDVKYMKDYEKEKDHYEYIWSFAKGQGMYRYVRKGDLSLEGIIIKSE